MIDAYQRRDELWEAWQAREAGGEWTNQWWFATRDELRGNDFNLSAGRYRPLSQAQVEHRDPLELLDELKAIEVEIMEEMEALGDKLREVGV